MFLKTFLKKLVFNIIHKKYKVYNVLLNHHMENGSTLLSEIKVCGLHQLEAEKHAVNQVYFFNKKFGTQFSIENIWEIKHNNIKMKNKKTIPELSENEKSFVFSKQNFEYLKEGKKSLYRLH